SSASENHLLPLYRAAPKRRISNASSPLGTPTCNDTPKGQTCRQDGQKNPYATAKDVQRMLQKRFNNITLSEPTVRWVLSNKLDYKVGKANAMPMMTKSHIERRLEFCEKYQNDNWEYTVFSDETSIQMHQNTLTVRWKEGEPRPRVAKPKH